MKVNDQEVKIIDADECARFIERTTGIKFETVLKVMDAETEYMIQSGIATID